jgi:hypothetical protein
MFYHDADAAAGGYVHLTQKSRTPVTSTRFPMLIYLSSIGGSIVPRLGMTPLYQIRRTHAVRGGRLSHRTICALHNLANPRSFGKRRLMHRRPGGRPVADWRLGVAPRQIVRVRSSLLARLDEAPAERASETVSTPRVSSRFRAGLPARIPCFP